MADGAQAGKREAVATRQPSDERASATRDGDPDERATPSGSPAANGHPAADDRPPLTFARRMPSLQRVSVALGRLIRRATVAITVVIALGIAFEVLGANDDKWIVSAVEDAAKFLAAPFDGMFTPDSDKFAVAINWGIAIAVYAIIGRLLARLVKRAAARAR